MNQVNRYAARGLATTVIMSAGLLAGCGAQASVAKGPDSAPAAPAAVRPDMTYRKGDLIKRRGNQQMAVA